MVPPRLGVWGTVGHMRRAGVSGLPGVRAGSIRAWAGVQVYRSEGIEAAAAAMGCRSLDAAARIVEVAR